jgi:hypothetical protein
VVVSRSALIKLLATEPKADACRLTITAQYLKSASWSLHALQEESMPRAESRFVAKKQDLVAWQTIDTQTFVAGLSALKEYRCEDFTKTHLSGVFWQDAQATAVGAGATAIAIWDAMPQTIRSMLIPLAVAEALPQLLTEETAEISQSDGWLWMRSGNTTIAATLGDVEKYPGLWQTIWEAELPRLAVQVEALATALTKCKALQDPQRRVLLAVVADGLEVYAASTIGQARVVVPATHDVPPCKQVCLSLDKLIAAVNACSIGSISIALQGQNQPAFLQCLYLRQVLLPLAA